MSYMFLPRWLLVPVVRHDALRGPQLRLLRGFLPGLSGTTWTEALLLVWLRGKWWLVPAV